MQTQNRKSFFAIVLIGTTDIGVQVAAEDANEIIGYANAKDLAFNDLQNVTFQASDLATGEFVDFEAMEALRDDDQDVQIGALFHFWLLIRGSGQPRIFGHGSSVCMVISRDVFPLRCLKGCLQSVKGLVLRLSIHAFKNRSAEWKVLNPFM